MKMESDGTRSVQWGTASNADTTTGPTGATPSPTPPLRDSTSASAAGRYSYPFGKDNPDLLVPSEPYPATYREFQQRLQDRMRTPDFALPEFTAGKQAYLVRVTDEQLGLAEVWPVEVLTPEERELARKVELQQEKQRVAGITARLATAHLALHPIIELHSPGTTSWSVDKCQGCDSGAYAEDDPEWPCRTIELILEGLGG